MTPRACYGALCLSLVALLSLWQRSHAIQFDPCSPIKPVLRGQPFIVGLAFWPGGTADMWGSEDPLNSTFVNLCNVTTQGNLSARGVYFSTYQAAVDRLTVLKTTYPEILQLTNQPAAETAPKVISVVAFRDGVRSEPRYVASFEKGITIGEGFVSSLSLVSKFELGTLKLLQWYNLTCNDCGGVTSQRCLNFTSCALPDTNCTCTAVSSNQSLTVLGEPCSYANMTYCATSVNLAFDGLDSASAAFQTASMIRKLNSYSLVSLFYTGKAQFLGITGLYSGQASAYWGKFQNLQQGVADAYSGNAAAGQVTGTAAGTVVSVSG